MTLSPLEFLFKPSRFSQSTVRLFVVFLCLLLALKCFSQDESPTPSGDHDKVHFYLFPQVGIPSEELKKAVKNDFGDVGIGFASGILFNPFGKQKPSPFFVGADFGYLTYGVDKIPETTTTPPIKTSFNIYTISGAIRMLGNQKNGFTPFIDGMIGAKIFNTRTRIDKDVLNIVLNTDQPEILNTTNDESLNYTLGIGFFNRKADEGGIRCSFSMRFLYSWGGDAKYVVRNSISLDANNNIQYQTGYTSTDMFLVQLGIQLY